ncbi:hypothetical protein AGMMS50268_41110 [Spirochaetia bacterium]|nr:hypothetical protein AGMMS50268_41110 [Spirochaetia bacterium]
MKKIIFMVFATVVLVIGIMAVGCASAPKESPIVQESPVALESNGSSITPKLDELLRKYAGPRLGVNINNNEVTYYYYLNHLLFEEFKYELDAGGEYTQSGSGPEDRDKEQGMTLARWVARPSGGFQLELFTEDDSGFSYGYKKVPQASGLNLDELLCKYAGSYPQRWDGEGKGVKYVYFLDSLRFEEFKAELDAGGEYYQTDSWNSTRDWDRGVTFVRFEVRPDGRFQLELCKADNSVIGYGYKKGH